MKLDREREIEIKREAILEFKEMKHGKEAISNKGYD